MIIREATLSDAEGIAKVHVDCWRTTYKSIISDDILKNLSYEQRTNLWINNITREDNYIFVVENEDGKIIGFTDGGSEKSGEYPGYDGDVTSIYILEEYQGQGIGKKLLNRLFEEFESLDLHSAIVKVLEKNGSYRFYEAMGAERVVDNKFVQIGSDRLKLLVYGWRNLYMNA
ncbi:GNAT family N-acetyltransferase [Virgibacillus ndiopensis]|uniref:GNAT family N-acetyltransferase n=1 Tax=Virgibacillus ndiopensis TaxID=2004408 RepID=UPI000C08251A|nr:GNAT family N-acetyltransferase [Virgibacillus ndiopensis]